jgi:TPR repeat protein
MYYYGLYVEKNMKRAYDYFKSIINSYTDSFNKGEENDAYFNEASLLIEGNGVIDVDYATAYKYLNFVAAKGHTYGTYLFGINNDLFQG